ncbi:MAG: type I DNA topoisomerase [Bdellovibrionales bacterium]|nr:type I DNA topoisomerase [Bdellovibrionales bacterium]
MIKKKSLSKQKVNKNIKSKTNQKTIKSSQNASKKLVIVESPTKAKTIRKFLDSSYMVESCMGHVRDLPQSAKDIPEKFKKQSWANLGVNVESRFEPIYCIPKNKLKIVQELKEKLQQASELILATDEDREGESISWHLVELLKPSIKYKRMVFHEITKEAILNALEKFRNIDENLVRAQEARRVLDRLVGYTISPLLWKKVAFGLSAGRVQSVAVRLIAEREQERIRFKKAVYSTLVAQNKKGSATFESKLYSYKSRKIALGRDFDGETGKLFQEKVENTLHLLEPEALRISEMVSKLSWIVEDVEEKPISRKPSAPFITSTLQQEANRKLGLGARETMSIAQKLYENGLITYMRTDSTNLSAQAIEACRSSILSIFGKEYLPSEHRDYTSKKVKGAQEAHEAIRPAGTKFIVPESSGLMGIQYSLYELIWRRTIASQMVNSQHKQVSLKLRAGDALFNASGMTVEFSGYLKVYSDSEEDSSEKEVHLPRLKVGDSVECLRVNFLNHETKPPSRYNEASLIQTLEKEGVGRPSTYAAIISTIQDRGYVKKNNNILYPTFTALVVIKLLSRYLPDYVDLKFTSAMEERLDDIASGELDWVKYLTSIYFGTQGLKAQVDMQEKAIKGDDSRAITFNNLPGLIFKVGRYGAYVCRKNQSEEVCASLPETIFPGDMTSETANKLIDQKISGADALGHDPLTGLPVYVLTGRFGPYVQLGDMNLNEEKEKTPKSKSKRKSSHKEEPNFKEIKGQKKKEMENKVAIKPKRMSIPTMMDPAKITLKQALDLLSLPKKLGTHPSSGKEVKKGLGRFGPYVVHDGDFRSVPKTDDIFQVSLERALELLAQPKKGRGRASPIRELGLHPDLKEEILIFNGKFGLYLKVGKLNVSLPEGVKPEEVDRDQALKLIAEKSEKSQPSKSKRKK